MLRTKEIKELVVNMGADLCGIASVERFHEAPPGFAPSDIYAKTQSIIVFAKQVPSESLFAQSCIPYTHVNTLVMQQVDALTLNISLILERHGIKTVPIPTDEPYEYWDSQRSTGRAILSLRHAGYLAGLGKLGKNTLLINRQYGNMIQLGAVLTDVALDQDRLADYEVCPSGCEQCVNACPTQALDCTTVRQDRCRPLSVFRHEKGYILKKCWACRKVCPHVVGIRDARRT